MAYRRTGSRRRTYASRRPAARTRTRRASVRRSGRRSVTAQTLRIVVEQIPASGVSRAIGPFVKAETKKPKKASL